MVINLKNSELASEQIRVNAVSPGVINTPMTTGLFDKMGPSQIAVRPSWASRQS